MTSAKNTMSRLRHSAIDARRSMSDEARANASSIICHKVIHSHEFMSCETIACYLPLADEVDPIDVIDRAWCAKKRIFSPVIDMRGNMIFRQLTPNTDLRRNNFGLLEPVSGTVVTAKSIDLVITPVVAFDNEHHRIGMGGGYFDRSFYFLKHRKKWLRPKLLGVAFDCQEVEKFAPNPWDIPLYQVITERS
ncbi:MAG: 5-formyltetrahydrofolate cyclo-ligase [Gammaproteobacteria bacterium]|nr:5-formyltetrahydrofolate cyclo-ligase [Gammaproteobacteria bacterium]